MRILRLTGNPLHTPITRRATLRAMAAAPSMLAVSPAAGDEGDDGPFRHGVASGDPDATGVVLWPRVTTSGPVSVTGEIAHDPAFTRIAARTATGPERDHTVKLLARSLELGRTSPGVN